MWAVGRWEEHGALDSRGVRGQRVAKDGGGTLEWRPWAPVLAGGA